MMGNGDGTFTPTYDIFSFYLYTYPLYASHLDGSVFADLFQIDANTTNEMRVMKGGPASALQIELEDSIVTGNASCGWVFPDVASTSASTVTLSSSVAGVMLPSSITVPASATSAQFCYTLAPSYDWHQVFDVNAQLNGSTSTAYASQSYFLGFSEAVAPSTVSAVYEGQQSNPVTISLTAAAGYSSTVNLSCEGMNPGDSCQFGSSSLALSSAGAVETTVILNIGPNSAQYGNTDNFTIVADDGNVIQRQTITVPIVALTVFGVTGSISTLSPGSASILTNVEGIPPYSLSCSGLPSGATCAFSGAQLPYPSTSTFNLAIAVPTGLSVGNYPFEINVSSGSVNASTPQTLAVIGFSVQGPPASSDWVIVGTTQNIPVSIQASSNAIGLGNISITCTLDSGGSCAGGGVPSSQTAQTFNLSVSVPSGTATGQHQLNVVATYGNFTQSYSFPVYFASISGSLSASTVTTSDGGASPLTATLNATNGFVDSLSLACSGSNEITCSFNPASPTLTGGTPQTVTVTLTAGDTARAPAIQNRLFSEGLLSLATLIPLSLFWRSRRHRRSSLFLFVAGAVLLVSISSCGSGGGSAGGSGGGGGGGIGGGGSSPNTYAIKVTASPGGTSVVETLGTVRVIVNQ